MRKQNCSSTPALKDEGRRLINSVVRSRKRPNALKHGVFSDAPLIPGEDSDEYEQLRAELMDEWKPAGPTLRNEVDGLADLRWKQRRLKKFVQTKLGLSGFDPSNPAFDEGWGLIMFTGRLRSEPETCFEKKHARKYLRPDKIDYLEENFPRSNYQSTSEWVKAVTTEIFLVLFPRTEGDRTLEAPELVKEAARQWRADCRVACAIPHERELLEYELKQGELLEARIARKIKFCFELKTMEEMLSKT